MITVINPGLFTTVQDTGRWGYQAYGMPVAGAMDRYAYKAANLLVGNKPDAAVLEMTMKGGSFRFNRDCQVSICGADMQAALNGQKVANWSGFAVTAGSELCFEFAVNGCRAYVAVRGGIDVPLVLGSRSTYTRAFVGGLEGRALKAGDSIPVGNEVLSALRACVLPSQFVPCYTSEISLRVLLGPQDDLFDDSGIETLFNSSYGITSEADRMGYRLEGNVIKHKGKADIVSDALCQGAIQVPGHGMPIIMMADRQTTGGYAKIGTVIGPDLALLAQAKPGDTVTFKRCTEEQAVAALKEEYDRYAQMAAALLQDNRDSRQTRSFQVTVNGQNYNVEIQEMI